MTNKRAYIHTFGCQMNVYDSDRMMAMLKNLGYEQSDSAEQADLIIVNTCSIRHKAEQKAMSELGRYRRLKKARPDLIIALSGCLAQGLGQEILHRAPQVDLVFGTRNINRLPELLSAFERDGCRRAEVTPEPGYLDSLEETGVAPPQTVSAFVTIMQGCDNYCSFCVVPYLRGPEESRKPTSIIAEIRALVAQGVKEVTLLGQNVNSYGKKEGLPGFAQLLEEIAAIDGLERIRFTTSHPRDLSDDLIALFNGKGKICNHIHLPVQSGSDRILTLMNRGYSREDYLAKIAKLREKSPDVSITSDIIVGFPGETEEDFSATLDLMERVKFDGLFSFKYSERKGTRAADLPDKLADAVKARRLKILQSLQDQHTWEKNLSWVGRRVQVLVEKVNEKNGEDLTGRTRENRIVNFPGRPELVGSLTEVFISEAFLHSLRGQRLS